MTLHHVLAEAIDSLRTERLRASLSGLGIVAGVATVIATLAIADGARNAAIADIGAMGIDTLHVAITGDGRSNAIDIERQLRRIPGVQSIVLSTTDSLPIRSITREASASVIATSADLHNIIPTTINAGRWLTDRDLAMRKRVAVITDDVARDFYPQRNAVERDIWIQGDRYLVVGVVAASRGASVYVPASARRTDSDLSISASTVQDISLRVAANDVVAAGELVRRWLRDSYGDAAPSVVVPRELLDARLRAQRTGTVVLVSIGLLALVISGVGIMNIMLASVAERTGEIGVRRAVGARRASILMQFIAESMLLCVAGAAVGIPLGLMFAGAVGWWATWPVAISITAIAIAIALACATGLGFGIYPARLAAKITPIEAMRAL